MDWVNKYPNAETCRLVFSEFLDQFHYMYNNHTQVGLGMSQRAFNITGVISNNFAQTFYYCFLFEQQI